MGGCPCLSEIRIIIRKIYSTGSTDNLFFRKPSTGRGAPMVISYGSGARFIIGRLLAYIIVLDLGNAILSDNHNNLAMPSISSLVHFIHFEVMS